MSDLVFGQAHLPSVAVVGTPQRYEVRRIFCVGRNYAEHALEMGNAVDRSAPFYFTKSPFSVVTDGADFPYPDGTQDCHYEMEFVVFIGAEGYHVQAADAMGCVFGYACGLDMTRRDLQATAKEKRRPWDTAKDFEHAAILGAITPANAFGPIGDQSITLNVNGTQKQKAHLRDMIHSVPDVIADLSRYYRLRAGDIIMTGTPAGVGPIARGDQMVGQIDGLSDLSVVVA